MREHLRLETPTYVAHEFGLEIGPMRLPTGLMEEDCAEGVFIPDLGHEIGSGAGCRDRTRDPLITNQVLYQLS